MIKEMDEINLENNKRYLDQICEKVDKLTDKVDQISEKVDQNSSKITQTQNGLVPQGKFLLIFN